MYTHRKLFKMSPLLDGRTCSSLWLATSVATPCESAGASFNDEVVTLRDTATAFYCYKTLCMGELETEKI